MERRKDGRGGREDRRRVREEGRGGERREGKKGRGGGSIYVDRFHFKR